MYLFFFILLSMEYVSVSNVHCVLYPPKIIWKYKNHDVVHFQENRRLEMELLDCNEKLVDAQNQITKLQTSLDNIMKDKVQTHFKMLYNGFS